MGDGPPLEAAPRAPLGPPPHNYFTQVANPGGVALLGPPPTTQPWLAGSYARARGSGSPPSSRRSYRRARCAARRRFASSTQAVTLVLLLIPAWLRAALGCVVDAGALLLLQAHRLLLDPPLGCLRSFLSSALRLRLRDRRRFATTSSFRTLTVRARGATNQTPWAISRRPVSAQSLPLPPSAVCLCSLPPIPTGAAAAA